jgi:hypothetical protein
MKITKSQLKRIIKEELLNILKEGKGDIPYSDLAAMYGAGSGRKGVPLERGSTPVARSEDPDSDEDDAAELKAGLDLSGFELIKDRGYYFIVDKETGEKAMGPFITKSSAETRMQEPGLRSDFETSKNILQTKAGVYSS